MSTVLRGLAGALLVLPALGIGLALVGIAIGVKLIGEYRRAQ